MRRIPRPPSAWQSMRRIQLQWCAYDPLHQHLKPCSVQIPHPLWICRQGQEAPTLPSLAFTGLHAGGHHVGSVQPHCPLAANTVRGQHAVGRQDAGREHKQSRSSADNEQGHAIGDVKGTDGALLRTPPQCDELPCLGGRGFGCPKNHVPPIKDERVPTIFGTPGVWNRYG